MSLRDSSFDDDSESDLRRAPWWPVIFQIILLLLSFTIALMIYVVTPVVIRENMLLFSLVGYVFTPVLTTGLLAVVRGKDLRDRSIPGYYRLSGKSRIKLANLLSLLSFLMSIPLIWQLATEIVARV